MVLACMHPDRWGSQYATEFQGQEQHVFECRRALSSLAWRPVLTVHADLRREHAYVGTFRRVLSFVSRGC
jgi:hypothetical protein